MGDKAVEVTDSYRSSRRFQMWLYDVGHRQLLLRSVKADLYASRVDVLFKDVDLLNLTTTMNGLTIDRRDDGFLVAGSDWNGLVRAAVCFVEEDGGEYFDPSPFSSSLRGGGS